MLGNEKDATFIRDWYLLMAEHYRSQENPPCGFKRLGFGCYRVAYLHEATNVVYKIEHRYDDCGQTNLAEYRKLRSYMLRKMPKDIRFPQYHLWKLDGRTVAAMEYFPKLLWSFSRYGGEGEKYWTASGRLGDALPDLWDTHGANIAVDEENGQIVPIDLGA